MLSGEEQTCSEHAKAAIGQHRAFSRSYLYETHTQAVCFRRKDGPKHYTMCLFNHMQPC